MLKNIAALVLLALEIACFVGFTFHGIIREQELREYRVEHRREYQKSLSGGTNHDYHDPTGGEISISGNPRVRKQFQKLPRGNKSGYPVISRWRLAKGY